MNLENLLIFHFKWEKFKIPKEDPQRNLIKHFCPSLTVDKNGGVPFHQSATKSSITLDAEVLQKFCLQFWTLETIVHLMNKPFDEKLLCWKGASMKLHSTIKIS